MSNFLTAGLSESHFLSKCRTSDQYKPKRVCENSYRICGQRNVITTNLACGVRKCYLPPHLRLCTERPQLSAIFIKTLAVRENKTPYYLLPHSCWCLQRPPRSVFSRAYAYLKAVTRVLRFGNYSKRLASTHSNWVLRPFIYKILFNRVAMTSINS